MNLEQINKALAEVSEACKGKTHGELVGLITNIDILRHEQGKLIDSLTKRLAATTAVADAAIELLRNDGRAIPYELAESYMAVTANAQSKIAKQNREHIQHSITVGIKKNRSEQARAAVNERHDQEGGSRDARAQLRTTWAQGNFSTRAECAEQERGRFKGVKGKELSLNQAIKYLRNTPDPDPWPADPKRKGGNP